MSGIFRDSFQNVVELLDDLFVRAAAAEEPPELNFIRKHSGAMAEQGLANSTARLFSNPSGKYNTKWLQSFGGFQGSGSRVEGTVRRVHLVHRLRPPACTALISACCQTQDRGVNAPEQRICMFTVYLGVFAQPSGHLGSHALNCFHRVHRRLRLHGERAGGGGQLGVW